MNENEINEKMDNEMIDGNPWVDNKDEARKEEDGRKSETAEVVQVRNDGISNQEEKKDEVDGAGTHRIDRDLKPVPETPPSKEIPTSSFQPIQPSQPSTSSTTFSPQTTSQPPYKLVITSNPIDISEFDPFASQSSKATPAFATNDNIPTSLPNSSTSPHPPPLPTRKLTYLSTSTISPSPTSRAFPHTPQPPTTCDLSESGGINRSGKDDVPPTPVGPVFDFQGFLTDLRGKSAESVARYLKSFLTNFAKRPFSVNEQVKLIHDFLEFIAGKMRLVEPWKSQSEEEFDNAMEAMEKLVMNRLYNYTFTPQINPAITTITTDDLERDSVLAQRIRLFGWIRAKHLDVPEGEASQGFLAFAEQELLKVNHYKAPRDKMICILNCCKVIFGLLRHEAGSEGTSADSFLPILIYVILRANPDNLLSNVEYIQRFRSSDKLQGEAGYYLSSLCGAISFIETMDASQLSHITQEEFERNVEKAIAELPAESPHTPRTPRSPLERPANATGSALHNTAEGEEPARALTNLPANIAIESKRFFQRTGEIASGAVNRPLSALGRLIDGIATGANSDAESEDGGSGDEQRNPHGRTISYRPLQTEIQQPHGVAGWFTPSHRQSGLAPGLPGLQYDGSGTPSRSSTPGENDPTFNLSALTAEIDRTTATARQAGIQTLHQMFPSLDEDVAGVVLDSCEGDLGMAIDRMLEMAAGG